MSIEFNYNEVNRRVAGVAKAVVVGHVHSFNLGQLKYSDYPHRLVMRTPVSLVGLKCVV